MSENPDRSYAVVQTTDLQGDQDDVAPPSSPLQQKQQQHGRHDDTINSSTTFDHTNCHPKDRRLLFRDQLVTTQLRNGRQVLDFDVIEHMVSTKPKLTTFRYIFQYDEVADPWKEKKTKRRKKRSHEIFPLSRILCFCPPLSLVQCMIELHPPALSHADEEGRLPIHFACRFDATFDVIEYLMRKNDQFISRPTIYGALPLHYAVANQSLDVVKFIVDRYPDGVKSPKSNGSLPLHQACAFHRNSFSEEIIFHLLSLYPEAACRSIQKLQASKQRPVQGKEVFHSIYYLRRTIQNPKIR